MKEIITSNGYRVKVDDEDYSELAKYNWKAKRRTEGRTMYAYAKIYSQEEKRRVQISMHRLIMGFPEGKQVDHIDWDGLNNQKSNLRICTANDNCRWVRPRSNTGYLGVSRQEYKKNDGTLSVSYKSAIKANGVQYWLGTFKTLQAAVSAYNNKAQELFGEFANINNIK